MVATLFLVPGGCYMLLVVEVVNAAIVTAIAALLLVHLSGYN